MSKLTNYLKLLGIGFLMGTVDLVPGVSGGTVAFVFGVYPKLLETIKHLTGPFWKLVWSGQWRLAYQSILWGFLLPLGFGIILAIFSMASVIKFGLQNYPEQIWGLFFGLVLGSGWLMIKQIRIWNWVNALAIMVATGGTFWLVNTPLLNTPNTTWSIFLSGMLAICAMILPGISGSYMLLLVGKYEQIINAVVARDSLTLGVFVLGILLGLSLFVRFLSWWLHRHFALTVSVLAGVVLGSLVKIWPWKERLSVTEDSKLLLLSSNVWPDWSNPTNWLVVILIVLGFVLILVSNRWSVADDFEKKSKT